MFKSLRDRLKGVAAQLEDELESQLDRQLEEELAAEVARSGSARGEAEDAAPGERGEADKGAADEAADEPSGAPAVEPAAERAAEPAPRSEEAPAPTDDEDERDSGASRPADKEDGPRPPAPTEPASAEAPPAGSGQSQADAGAEKRTSPAPPEKPRQRVTGRKMLSEEEVEARLARELGEAVEVQRDVEKAVRGTSTAVSRYTINEDVLDGVLWELEVALLESDVALPVIDAIKGSVRDQLLSMSVDGRDPAEVVEKVLRAAIRRVLNVNAMDFDGFVRDRLDAGKRPVVVMFVGVNGTGKTTSIARIAHRLKENGVSSVMAAGDTFRAGAIEQLSLHGERLGVRVVKHKAGADPAAVAYDAIEHAKARHKDVVLLDTAGRMQTNTNLMDEMDKIRRVAKPDLVVFVGDSLAGNDAVEQARRFDDVVDIDGAILTKVDVDAKGGAALSVAYTINKPLLFIGVGQDYPDLERFDADRMVDRLFGGEAPVEAAA